jgi:HAD superfamily phosphoserine phosphatase-like hydrolase
MKEIALFDFDETLVEENSLSYLFKFLLGNKPLFLYLLPILFDYRIYIGRIKTVIKNRLYNISLSGRATLSVYEAGRDTARKLSIIDGVVDRMMKLDDQGVDVWIITASPQSFVQGIVDELKWPVKRVVGTMLESHNGTLNGLIGEECQLQEKVHRFNDIVEIENLQCIVKESYGNLPVDIPMLSLAQNKFYVENAKLRVFQDQK